MPISGPQCEWTLRVTDAPATFVGIDLAWSHRNPSGGAVIRDGVLLTSTGALGSDGEIIDFVKLWVLNGAPAVIGIDAPLRVPNEAGSRTCDRDLSADWRDFDAGALPANRKLLAVEGRVRGEVLVAMLRSCCGFDESTVIPQRTRRRLVCEVYPHPAQVSLFGSAKTLKYKARKGRSLADRRVEFERYHGYLAKLRDGDPPVAVGLDDLLSTDLSALRGKALKTHEDRLDAVTCAYIVCYLWHHGPKRTQIYGSLEGGHILVPMI